MRDSNSRHLVLETNALPTELNPYKIALPIREERFFIVSLFSCELVEDIGDLTRTYRTTTLADCEAETLIACYRSDEFYSNLYVITGHYHLYTLGQSDFTCNVERTDVELRTIVVVERSVTTTLFFLQDIYRSLEFRVRMNLSRVADNHTTFYLVLVDTAEQETYVITSLALVKYLTEHLNARNNRFLIGTQTCDLHLVAYFYNTSFDTTGSNSTTTCDREYVLNRHQEGFIYITGRQRNPCVNSVHKLHYFLNPLGLTVQCTECRTADDRSIFAIIVIFVEKFAHLHFNELEHLFIFYLVAFVQENNQTRNVHLTSQEDVLTSLGHRTISSSNYDDSTVHLSSTSYHVLNVVGVSGAVYVSIVTVFCFILNVCSVYSNTSLFFLGSVVDLVERLHLRKTFGCENAGDSSGQRCFTVVYVANSTDVNMRFGPLECFFCHSLIL